MVWIVGFVFDSEYGVFGQTRWLIVDDYMMLDTQHSYGDKNTIGLLEGSDAYTAHGLSDVEGSLSL
jgi:hypothetical protein